MKRADIFLEMSNSSPKAMKRQYGYVLEYKSDGEERTREGFGETEGTCHQVTLKALIEAMERFHESCEICIHSEDAFILNMMEHNLETWAEKEFQTAKGKPVVNREEWMQIWELSKKHLILTEPGEHEYSGWLLSEMKGKENS